MRAAATLRRLRGSARRLGRAEDGNTILEFALISPAFFLLLLGTANVGQMIYAKVLLNGAIETAARAASTENGNITTADAMVRQIMRPVVPGATFSITRSSYYSFTDVSRAEKFTDSNGNGRCDNGETYIDENADGNWDTDVARTGQGGADDVVVYQVSVTYTPIFKVPFMPNQWSPFTLTSKSVKKNQPYSTQAAYSTTTRVCT